MRQSNMGRNQEIISLEEYLQKRLAIREKESLENSHKKKKSRRKHNCSGISQNPVNVEFHLFE